MDLIDLAERAVLPDWLIRLGMRRLMADRLRDVERGDADEPGEATAAVPEQLRRSPIAIATDAANVQHYEVPSEFFQRVLGPRLKYSCCYWPQADTTLAAGRRRDAGAVLPAGGHRGRHGDPGIGLWLGLALASGSHEHYPRCSHPGDLQFADPAGVHRVALPRPRTEQRRSRSPPTLPISTPNVDSTGCCRWRCSSTCAITTSCSAGYPPG